MMYGTTLKTLKIFYLFHIISPHRHHNLITPSEYDGSRLEALQPNQNNGDKFMKNKMLIVIAGLLAALLVVGVIGATNTFAQGSNNLLQHGRGPGGPHGLGQPELEAAAKVLGMTTDEVSTALQSGKTLQDLADEAGVKIED